MSKDEIGDRMKEYEARFCPRLMPLLPTLARIDGKAFHTYTRRLDRPFDQGFVNLMRTVTRLLVQETRALAGYTQSDEITLMYYSPTTQSQIFFDGKAQKMTSVLASMATAHFHNWKGDALGDRVPAAPAFFDCRVWQVPTLCEAANVFVWRELDATRNSVEMLARHYYSHKQLLGKKQSDLHDLLHIIGINWNDCPAYFKRGSYFGWREFDIEPELAVTPEEKVSPPRKRKKVCDLALEPILTYPDRVRTLFGIEHACEVTL